MATSKLTLAQIRDAKFSSEKDENGRNFNQLYDGDGLFLQLTRLADGETGKYWRMKTAFRTHEGAKPHPIMLALGVFPKVSLDEARKKRAEILAKIDEYIDPRIVKEKRVILPDGTIEGSFKDVAHRWYLKGKESWKPSHSRTVLARLEQHLYPYIGNTPLDQVTADQISDCVKKLVERGVVETASRVLIICKQVYQYAAAWDITDKNPAARATRRNLIPTKVPKHYPAITDPAEVAKLLRDIYAYKGSFVVQQALKLVPLVFLRPGEFRTARWVDFDFNRNIWEIYPSKLKDEKKVPMNKLIIPLSKQALAILKQLKPLTGNRTYVFEGRDRGRPISDNTINQALRRSGITKDEMVAHGFRAMARTMLAQELNQPVEYIERQLSHTVPGPLARAYDRTDFLEQRRMMMQRWADYLDDLRFVGPEGANC